MRCDKCGALIEGPVACVTDNGETRHYDVDGNRVPRTVTGNARVDVEVK